MEGSRKVGRRDGTDGADVGDILSQACFAPRLRDDCPIQIERQVQVAHTFQALRPPAYNCSIFSILSQATPPLNPTHTKTKTRVHSSLISPPKPQINSLARRAEYTARPGVLNQMPCGDYIFRIKKTLMCAHESPTYLTGAQGQNLCRAEGPGGFDAFSGLFWASSLLSSPTFITVPLPYFSGPFTFFVGALDKGEPMNCDCRKALYLPFKMFKSFCRHLLQFLRKPEFQITFRRERCVMSSQESTRASTKPKPTYLRHNEVDHPSSDNRLSVQQVRRLMMRLAPGAIEDVTLSQYKNYYLNKMIRHEEISQHINKITQYILEGWIHISVYTKCATNDTNTSTALVQPYEIEIILKVPQCLFCPFSRLIPCKKIQEGGIHLICPKCLNFF
ncbi:hypothetical protein VP01_3919g1 [Puccinia sorghi]|uniref:SWIM-type domain-containing protein n=1 Tax=Puccinia sorghi TaxID=27349 RepID=A0A0L6UUI6_9BASI|nr:hypothetical protein VP01_3919g1 [Puccinia sorghi]